MTVLEVDYCECISTNEELENAINEIMNKSDNARGLIRIAYNLLLKAWQANSISKELYANLSTLLSSAEDQCDASFSIADAIDNKGAMLKENK